MHTSRLLLSVKLSQVFLACCLGMLVLLPWAQPASAKACASAPARPQLQFPVKYTVVHVRNVTLRWGVADCAANYAVIVRKGAADGRPVDAMYELQTPNYSTHRLETGSTYWWVVEACNSNGCKTSRWGKFSIAR